jgi:hypothetical protein
MNRTLIALASLALALPALAHERDDDMDEDDYGYSYQPYDYQTSPSEQGPSMDDFRNDRELSWSGEWIDTPEYGVVWRPTRVDSDWRPYQYGRWEWTTVGWAWVSEEPFGWAVYHYGRWAYAGDLGWTWVPGRVWAPAWVAWRWGGGYAGWCPLGPRGVVIEQPGYWVFVPAQRFLDPIRRNVIPIPDEPALYGRTRPLPIGGGPHAGPIAVAVERATGRGLRPIPIADAPTPRVGSSTSRVYFYRPGGVATQQPSAAPVARPNAGPRPIHYGSVPSQGAIENNRPHAVSGGAPHAVPAPAPARTTAAPQPQSAPHAAPSQTKPHAQ